MFCMNIRLINKSKQIDPNGLKTEGGKIYSLFKVVGTGIASEKSAEYPCLLGKNTY